MLEISLKQSHSRFLPNSPPQILPKNGGIPCRPNCWQHLNLCIVVEGSHGPEEHAHHATTPFQGPGGAVHLVGIPQDHWVDQVWPRKKCSFLERKKTDPNTGGSLREDDQSSPLFIDGPLGDGLHSLLPGVLAAPFDEDHLMEPEDSAQEGGVLVLIPDQA